MSRRTQAEIFIQTLEEMLDHERERKKARLRRQLKAHVKRFVAQFRTDFNGVRRPSEWTPQGRRTAPETVPRFRDE